ncbi:MAG TPA: YqgE/AlgH family protein [Vicinamibacterales bacterium]|jgi:putative transcriptional regulator|nr:YqgE/AlgH family protein [Vicinamibacterales bacterium]
MSRVLAAAIVCLTLVGAIPLAQGRAAAAGQAGGKNLKPGMLLYAMPGLPDSNFAKTVVLLLDHGSEGSMGVVLNRPTKLGVDEALDLKPGTSGIDLDVYWGGPVQPEAVLSLVRSPRPGPKARTILSEVYLTPDLADAKQVFDERDGRLRVRIFSGYAGWARGQLAAEVRERSWVLEPADAATVFSVEPSRMWEKVHDILGRMSASSALTGRPAHVAAGEQVQVDVPNRLTGVGVAVEHGAVSRVTVAPLGRDLRRAPDHLSY